MSNLSSSSTTNNTNMNEASNSCVETPAAPEWLSKLENRREKLKRGRLGHEAGAGAPCVECGDKCPGLDLHFWRKVCRNCKCRKDQHMCNDDDLSGWAQFEILGQIRSKPAFIKIKALANQPIQVDWVPPNVAADIISDYMDKLGATQIPVAGSDAALKRKQQLEFQVPPHDLDATLCDNLTESEAQQLQQYVQKIRENCVGQGNVVRVGSVVHAVIGHLPQVSNTTDTNTFKPEFAEVFATLGEEAVQDDDVINELLGSEKLTKAIVSDVRAAYPKIFIAFSEPIADSMEDFEGDPLLSQPTREKLCGLNRVAVKSLVHNGPIYDKILSVLKSKNLDITRDPILGAVADFRREFLSNPQFIQEINAITPVKGLPKPQYATPVKTPYNDLAFNSPLPLKNPVKTRYSAQMRQDTPMRKVTFGAVNQIIYDCGLPAGIDYQKDPIFAGVINAEPLKLALQKARTNDKIGIKTPIVLALRPLSPDYMQEPLLTPSTKDKLNALQVNGKAVQSALLNAPYYDQLFSALDEKGLDYGQCKLLQPIADLREQLAKDKPFYDEVREFVAQMPNSFDVVLGNPQHIFKPGALSNSLSNDSGFDSKPTTPSHSGAGNELNAAAGFYAEIPGIEDMNMYPSVMPGTRQMLTHNLPQAFEQLHVSNGATANTPVLSCRDCSQPINFGEVAVKAERAGKEIAWHPSCFKCHTCRELLADLVYFFHAGQVYCGRDLAIKLKIPRCKACDELIFTKEYTAAEDATFHIKHFCCFQCDLPLAGRQYIPDEKTNMPLCLQCYDAYYAAACQRCKRPIGPKDQGVSWGDVHWHDTCFTCAGLECTKSLIGGRFCVKQNMPFCSPACVRSIIV